jgi:hypothetical protein
MKNGIICGMRVKVNGRKWDKGMTIPLHCLTIYYLFIFRYQEREISK